MAANRGWKETLLIWTGQACFYSIYGPLRGLYLCGRHTKRSTKKMDLALRRRRARARQIPKSKPIIQQQQKNLETSPTSFLHLPPELRLKIYDLALGDPCLVEPHVGPPEWHPRPCNWRPRQHIRGDDEAIHEDEQRTVFGLRAYGLLYKSRFRGRPDGSWERVSRNDVPWDWFMAPRYLNLMRTCHVVYSDLLDRLYGENTISLFGADMVHFFSRNASPEGLGRVRYVHTALAVTAQGWESQQEQESLEQAVCSLQRIFPKLEQLDLNVTVINGQPAKTDEFWSWLRNVLARHLANLQEFTLRISTYSVGKRSRCLRRRPRQRREQLEKWKIEGYQTLKAEICKH